MANVKSSFWGRDVVISQVGGRTGDNAGVSFLTEGLKDGKCGVEIESITKDHLGPWSCYLVAADGDIMAGQVEIATVGPQVIYFATNGGGIRALSPKTSNMSTIVRSSEDIQGITHDTTRNKLYWNSYSAVYRSEVNGNSVETVLSTNGNMRGLGFDWVTGNVYVVSDSDRGYIRACDARPTRSFSCATVLSGQGAVIGIALNPIQGIMYWIKFVCSGNSIIYNAGMDGSNPTIIVRGLDEPCGLVIDFQTSTLYWADQIAKKIQSSNLDGSGLSTLVQGLPKGPFGIFVVNNRLYWGQYYSMAVQSSTTTGSDSEVVYWGMVNTRHFVATKWDLLRNRTNDCEQQQDSCAGVCVLTPTSFRCL